MADVEVERRLKEAIASSTIAPVMPKLDTVLKTAFQYSSAPASTPIVPPGPIVQCTNKQLLPLTQVSNQETILHSSPAREEGEVPESELDPDTRRRLLILQHGMDMRGQATSEPPQFPVRSLPMQVEPPQFPVRPPPMQASAPRVEPHGGWFPLGEDMGQRQFNRIAPSPKEFSLHSEPMHIDKKHNFRAPPFVHKVEASTLPDRVLENQRLPKEVLQRDDRLRLSHSPPVHPLFPGEESSLRQSSSSNGDMDNETGGNDTFAESPAEYLHYIAFKCGTKVEFRPALVPGIKLLFSFEVWFAGEKIGDGTGSTRREAQHHAAESSLMNLADKYLSYSNPGDEGRFISDGSPFRHQSLLREESTLFPPASVPAKLEMPKKSSIDALNELCMMEGLRMTFQPQPQVSTGMGVNNELYAQVEIDGEVWGQGVGITWDEAKMQAAETAFQNLKAKIGQYPQKRQISSRSFQGMPTKRFRPEDPRVMQRMAASARYPKNASLIP